MNKYKIWQTLSSGAFWGGLGAAIIGIFLNSSGKRRYEQMAPGVIILGGVVFAIAFAPYIIFTMASINEKLLGKLRKDTQQVRQTTCPNCGAIVAGGANFCRGCGSKVSYAPTVDLAAYISNAERGGTRTAFAVPYYGDQVNLDQRLAGILNANGYQRAATVTGESLWAKGAPQCITYEIVDGAAVVAGFIRGSAGETNLHGAVGSLGKKQVIRVLLQLRAEIERG